MTQTECSAFRGMGSKCGAASWPPYRDFFLGGGQGEAFEIKENKQRRSNRKHRCDTYQG